MATPTTRAGFPQPGKNPSQVTASSPPVSTPFSASQSHTMFSPIGPRSSPQQLKKSPATSTTLLGHQHNGSLNVDSPLAAAAMGTLGLGGNIALSLDRVDAGGAPGISTNPGGEEERTVRLDSIIDILSVSKGRVSDVGLERLAQRLGLSTYFEESTFQGRKCKTLLIGGSALEITILMDRSVVYNVTVGYPMSSPAVTRHAESTSKILLEDLTLGVHRSPLTKTLEKFAANLEYLANLDKLSVMPGLDCHEALAGIFESLERLHIWDSGKLRENGALMAQIQNLIAGGNLNHRRSSIDHPIEQDADVLVEEYLKIELMCSRHGIPSMNAGSEVGLSIQYWADFRRSPNKNLTIGFQTQLRNKSAKLWSLRIGCAPLNNALFPAIRSSEKWLSTAVQKPNPLPEEILSNPTGAVLDWEEPEPTTLPNTDESKDRAADISEPRIPMVMFVARLDPPLTLPQAVWTQLFQATGGLVPVPNSYPTFDSIHFAIPAGVNHVASETRTIRCWRVLGVAEGTGDETAGAETVYDSTLFIYKPVYGQTLDVLPFSHPRQLVAILPVLRQYAFLTTILKQSFCQDEHSRHVLDTAKSSAISRTTNTKDELGILSSIEHGSSNSQRRKRLRLDVTLTVHPVPRFHVVFPFRSATADIVAEIRFNGSVYIVSQNVVPEPKVGMETEPRGRTLPEASAKSIDKEGLESLLEVFQDLCLWTQWIVQHLE